MNKVETNGSGESVAVKQEPEEVKRMALPTEQSQQKDATSEAKAKPSLKHNKRLLVLAGGMVVFMLLLALAFDGLLHSSSMQRNLAQHKKGPEQPNSNGATNGTSVAPILDAGHAPSQTTDSGKATPDLVGQTAKRQPAAVPPSLGNVTPFDSSQPWQAPPYRPGAEAAGDAVDVQGSVEAKNERDQMDKPSLVFVRSNASSGVQTGGAEIAGAVELSIGLPPGTRLRARLESAVSTAVRTPVVAVIEYNYEQNGAIVVPAGARAFGHLEAADRSGYVGVRFDSLLLPDGSMVGLEAAATDLQLRPLRGKVEGRNTGENILVRSFAGVGEIAATLVGRGNLDQPLSEGDLLRERVSSNIGQASDQTVANLAITQHIVVSVPAGTEIYVVLQKAAKESVATVESKGAERPATGSTSIQELRQLLQLQRELNQSVASAGQNQ